MSLGCGWSLLELRGVVLHRIVALFFSIEGEGKTARTCGKAYDGAELGGKQVGAVKAGFHVATQVLSLFRCVCVLDDNTNWPLSHLSTHHREHSVRARLLAAGHAHEFDFPLAYGENRLEAEC